MKLPIILLLVGAALCADYFPTVYEISTRPWLYQLSQKYGGSITLSSIPQEELQRIADLGFDTVWFMGVWQLGAYGLKHDRTDPSLTSSYSSVLPGWTDDDVIGSPYAIANYTTNSEIGSDSDLKDLKSRLNRLGLKLMVDLVPNHSAVDSPWPTSDPDVYITCPSGTCSSSDYVTVGDKQFAFGAGPYGDPWTDVIQYNFWNDKLRYFLKKVLIKIAKYADMVRCDMAMLMLNDVFDRKWGSVARQLGFKRPDTELWTEVLSAVKDSNPSFIVIGECYLYGITPQPEDLTLRQLGFDFTYEKTPLDDLKGRNLDGFRDYVASRDQELAGGVHFTENHDEPRAVAALGGQSEAVAGTIAVATLPGMRLVYFGQLEGFQNRLDVHLRRAATESPHSDTEKSYATFLSVLKDDVFKKGTWYNIRLASDGGNGWAPQNVLAWRWALEKEKRLVVVNYSGDRSGANVVVSDVVGKAVTITDLLTGTAYQRDGDTMRSTGLYVEIDGFSAQIFSYP